MSAAPRLTLGAYRSAAKRRRQDLFTSTPTTAHPEGCVFRKHKYQEEREGEEGFVSNFVCAKGLDAAFPG